MAQKYFGLDRGETADLVTEGSSSTATTDVEVRVDLAANMNKAEIRQALIDIIRYMDQHPGSIGV